MPKSEFSVHHRAEIETEAFVKMVSGSTDSREAILQAVKYRVEGLDPAHVRSYGIPAFLRGVDTTDICGIGMEHFLPNYLAVKCPAIDQRIGQMLVELEQGDSREEVFAAWSHDSDRVKQTVAQSLIETSRDASANQRKRRISLLSDREGQRQLMADVRKRLGDDPILKATALVFTPPPPAVGLVTSTISANLQNLRYLGPLRDEPRPLYGIGSGTDPSDVGNKGEFTAAVLDLFGSTYVDFLEPNNPDSAVRQVPLKTAVHAWLQHFEMATRCETKEAGKLGHHLYIVPAGIDSRFDLTNVGVGLSQVLPILVMALISDPESILLFEQPELHLHPRVQSLLGDFFLSVTKTGRQCIVETHSEYLVNRLRRRVAESPWDSKLGDDVLLYFVERKGAQSHFTPIDINPFGAIPAWPTGFFDQGPEESECIMAAAARKRASRKTQ